MGPPKEEGGAAMGPGHRRTHQTHVSVSSGLGMRGVESRGPGSLGAGPGQEQREPGQEVRMPETAPETAEPWGLMTFLQSGQPPELEEYSSCLLLWTNSVTLK